MFCVKLLVDAAHHHFHVWAGVFVKSVRVFSQPAHECDSSGVECGSE